MESCFSWSVCAKELVESGEDVLTDVCVEYTELFIGPPKPLVAPWESYYVGENVECGFGAPAFAMKDWLAEMDLAIAGVSNQYPDHMGIELMLLSELCDRVSQGSLSRDVLSRYVEERPASWSARFASAVAEHRPRGYYANIASLADALVSIV